MWIYGNPAIHVDDQFYLLVGQRLAEGYLPYVDLWDRKPIGLFLIYAFANRFMPDPVVGYQLLATASVVATAGILYTMARRLTGHVAALGGACAYLAWLLLFGGIGGQSPVFYNLPMAGAAVLTLAVVARPDASRLVRKGCLVMLLAGLAMQIKYAAVFEGIFFGLSLLWAGRRLDWPLHRLAFAASLWIAAALLPTLAVLGAYAVMGHGEAFIHANFVSIFSDTMPVAPAFIRLFWQSLALVPFWICWRIAARHWLAGNSLEARWLFAWASASIAGFLVFGNWFDHYILPLLMPLSLLAALAFEVTRRRRAVMALVIGLGLASGYSRAGYDLVGLGNARTMARLSAQIAPHLSTGCLYVSDDLSILYYLTRACLPTRFIFPDHLGLRRYDRALGVDQIGEMRRVLASRPTVIVLWSNPPAGNDYASRDLLLDTLKRDYTPVGSTRIGPADSADVFIVHALKPQLSNSPR